MYVHYCVILCALFTPARATVYDTKAFTDDLTLDVFYKQLFGEMWGYYLGWFFSKPTLVVLPAKETYCPVTMVQGAQKSLVKQVKHTRTDQANTSCEEICFSKYIAMILCFVIFGLTAVLIELKEDNDAKLAHNEFSKQCNKPKITKDVNVKDASSSGLQNKDEQLFDGILELDKYVSSIKENSHNIHITIINRSDHIEIELAGDTAITLNKKMLNFKPIVTKQHDSKCPKRLIIKR